MHLLDGSSGHRRPADHAPIIVLFDGSHYRAVVISDEEWAAFVVRHGLAVPEADGGPAVDGMEETPPQAPPTPLICGDRVI